MITQDDLREESILRRWSTFERKPSFVSENYWVVMLRMGLLLFAAILFKLVWAGAEPTFLLALISLGFGLAASFILMLGLGYLTEVYGRGRLFLLGIVFAVLATLIIILPTL